MCAWVWIHGPHAFCWQTGNSRAKHTLGCSSRIYSSHLSTDSTASFPWWWGLEWWDGFGFSPPRPSRCGHLCACVVGRSTPEESWGRWRKWEWVAGWCSWWLMACNCSDTRLTKKLRQIDGTFVISSHFNQAFAAVQNNKSLTEGLGLVMQFEIFTSRTCGILYVT